MNTLGDVDEGPTGPGGHIQYRELVITRGYALTEVLFEDPRVFA